MNTAIIIDKDELKDLLTEILRESAQSVIFQLRAELSSSAEVMTLAQTANYLQCSIQSIKNWSERGEGENPLPCGNAGADPRFYKSKVDNWLVKEKIFRRKNKKN